MSKAKAWGKTSIFIFIYFVFCVSFALAVPLEDKKSTNGVTASEEEEKVDDEKQKEIDAIKKEAEEAKSAAEEARLETEKAKQEEEALKRSIELEKSKLEVELEETEVSNKESELVAKTSKNKKEIKTATEKTKQEKKEDQQALERVKLAEEKMMISQKKAQLAEEEMKLAQQKLSIAMETLKQKGGKIDVVTRLRDSAIAVLVGLFLIFVLRQSVRRLEKSLTHNDAIRESEATLQIKTVAKLFNWLGTVTIMVAMVYIVLEKHGLDMAPLLAGAGIMGLAFGFGGQYLIRDLINGLFILIEGQYRLNDVIKIGGYGGLVEDMNLRITTLRDLEGRVIIVPNGEIKTVVNYTKEYSQALLSIGVAHKENVDRVMDVIKDTGKELREDTYFKKLIIDDLEMLGVDDFSDSAVIIKFRMKTLPIKQWEVMREFRRRLKNRFDELGIEIPFPHTTMYWGSGRDNDWMRDLAGKINTDGKL